MAGQVVPSDLETIALMDDKFKMSRMKKKMGLEFARGKGSFKK